MTGKRKTLSKKLRFDVLKRDRFTCQYCGAKAPDVLLHIDHVRPVADGGGDDILNLVAACVACNGGKGAAKLSEHARVDKQRAQIEELQARREQLEMMLTWRDEAESQKDRTVEEINARVAARGGFIPNESGEAHIRKWLRTYSVTELLAAMDSAFDAYMKFDGSEPNKAAWEIAFKKIPVFASMNRQAVERPHLPRVLYIQGILRKRSGEPYENFVERLEGAIEKGWSTEDLEEVAKKSSSWGELVAHLNKIAEARRGGQG